jgi:hypothetical protein
MICCLLIVFNRTHRKKLTHSTNRVADNKRDGNRDKLKVETSETQKHGREWRNLIIIVIGL